MRALHLIVYGHERLYLNPAADADDSDIDADVGFWVFGLARDVPAAQVGRRLGQLSQGAQGAAAGCVPDQRRRAIVVCKHARGFRSETTAQSAQPEKEGADRG